MRNYTTLVKISSLIILFLIPVSSYAALEISDGTVQALYHLEDVVDSSGNGYNLTNNGTTPFNAALLGNGADFGTTNTTKYLSINNDVGITGGLASISTWVKLQTEISTGLYTLVFQMDGGSKVKYTIFYYYNSGTRQICFSRGKPGVADNTVCSNLTMGTADWYHFVLTYDNTNVEGFVNGSSIGTIASSGGGSSGSDKLDIGADDIGGQKSSAIMDETVYLSKELSTDEITSLYNGGVGNEVCITAGCADVVGETSSSTKKIALQHGSIMYLYLLLFLGAGYIGYRMLK